MRHNARAVYQFYMGWFDGNPANLDPLPPQEPAKHYVALMGGADKAWPPAQTAFDNGDYRWAAELLNHAVFADPGHKAGQGSCWPGPTTSSATWPSRRTWRNFYLTGALRAAQRPAGAKALTPGHAAGHAAADADRALPGRDGGEPERPGAEGKNLKINLVFSDLP